RHGGELERRNATRRGGEQRQQRPHQDRRKAGQGGGRSRRRGVSGFRRHAMNWPPFAERGEPGMKLASSEARNTTQRAKASSSPRRRTGISGRMLFSSTSFGTACTISVLM